MTSTVSRSTLIESTFHRNKQCLYGFFSFILRLCGRDVATNMHVALNLCFGWMSQSILIGCLLVEFLQLPLYCSVLLQAVRLHG